MRTSVMVLMVLFALTACGGEIADADGGEVLYLPASAATAVTTSAPLLAGVTYEVVIEGSVSVWPPGDWSSVCAGAPSAAPEFASPGPTGPVGIDAEWVWAWPRASPSLCPNGVPSGKAPGAERNVRFQTSAAATPTTLPPAMETTMTPNHAYTYRIVGAGSPAVFSIHDAHPADNYGEYRIRITPGG